MLMRSPQAIRFDIFQATGCTASVGIGHNILLAKLATRQAKPNGQYHLTAAAAPAYLATMTVDRLPGVGWKLGRKLKVRSCDLMPSSRRTRLALDAYRLNIDERASPSAQEMGIATCGDLLPLSKEQLGQHFGKKVGETMWHYVRGTDERPLTTFKVRCTLRRGVSLARHLRPGVHVFVSVHPPCSNANRWASM